ncbi:MAG: RluA family pseudouridine synthase [Leptospira bouyouniensis]|uniref:RNA pseudouridine synthase n=1 Tax=Leptospira bouyouniensis TaxID=2484911 RepID=A0A7I0HMN5_9LEPT|nr:RNA pseudouridine synthase [Leptospira bouyouniensis]TGK48687.1 RNA pseudouridine synthase [Leptospira bouyouniensis]TGL02225.1 RNA pseudouridine synthase [Leptospira bouyouniensis]TGM81058.1 RNA pseudouridine synthase [Leptospira bouyouniensis]
MNSPRRIIRLKGNRTTRILYECEDFLLAEKPEGIPVHETKDPNRIDFTRLLANHLHIPNLRTVNRLDLGTSGIVLLGKNQNKNSELDNLLKEAEKTYLFICEGIPEWNEYRMECFLKEGNKEVNVVRSGGKKAITEFSILQTDKKENICLGLAKILTGRRHQIRVMLSTLGFPILGDSLYGKQENQESRMYLHSFRFYFTDLLGEKQMVQTDVPIEWKSRMPSISNISISI